MPSRFGELSYLPKEKKKEKSNLCLMSLSRIKLEHLVARAGQGLGILPGEGQAHLLSVTVGGDTELRVFELPTASQRCQHSLALCRAQDPHRSALMMTVSW